VIEGRRVLALIPARGGSKGLPRKNVLPLGGQPLIAWSVAAARGSRYVDRTVVSSDDAEIIAAARAAGAEIPFVRPAALAADDTPTLEVALHALDALEAVGPAVDYLALLQPTSPLRSAGDIDACLEACLREGAPSCVSVTRPDKSPYWMYTRDGRGRLRPLLPGPDISQRQHLPIVYALNGAVYVTRTDALRSRRAFVTEETLAWEMPPARSVDIDTDLDLKVAAALLGDLQA
jgi:CMP-N,N'-diacetyllegionaminic acid synthase